MFDKRSPSIA